MKHGKTIKQFLIEGDPNGRIVCELSNWTGKAYKIPRIKVKMCQDRVDLSAPGIYLLFGKDELGDNHIYIGEAESVYIRLVQQLKDKEFWTEAITFNSKDENLNKAHIKYLESRLFEIAKHERRYVIENKEKPTRSAISESDRAEMEEFIENVILLVGTLGHRVFDRKRENFDESLNKRRSYFYIKSARGADAKGEPTSDGFLVAKNSKIAIDTVKSYSNSLGSLRDKLIETKIIVNNKFMEDYIFNSPSYAAAIIMGRNANGLTEWKLNDGTTLKEFELK